MCQILFDWHKGRTFVLHNYACEKTFTDLRRHLSGQTILYENMRFCVPISSTNTREPRIVTSYYNTMAGFSNMNMRASLEFSRQIGYPS